MKMNTMSRNSNKYNM